MPWSILSPGLPGHERGDSSAAQRVLDSPHWGLYTKRK